MQKSFRTILQKIHKWFFVLQQIQKWFLTIIAILLSSIGCKIFCLISVVDTEGWDQTLAISVQSDPILFYMGHVYFYLTNPYNPLISNAFLIFSQRFVNDKVAMLAGRDYLGLCSKSLQKICNSTYHVFQCFPYFLTTTMMVIPSSVLMTRQNAIA